MIHCSVCAWPGEFLLFNQGHIQEGTHAITSQFESMKTATPEINVFNKQRLPSTLVF